MKKWVKYLLLSLSLIILVSGRVYSEPSLDSFNVSSAKKILKNKAEDKSLIVNLEQATDSDEILLELDEEDFSHSHHFTNFSFENNFYQTAYKNDSAFLWKKIAFKNIKLDILQNKIFILIQNLRI